ncbi:MAG: uracil-DNA glycosylase, partial [Gemmatimonadaceae bacterium]|nr:uracil-DNA glycosylase [Gemmatimonadaceae bacterium]
KLAIERFLPRALLSEVVGTKQTVAHTGGRSVVIPLPHPSGASSWLYQNDNLLLVDKAIELIAAELSAMP